LTYLNLFIGITLVRLFERAYDMSISYFQLISISSLYNTLSLIPEKHRNQVL